MVLKRKSENGFIGYDALNIPRARRSARKRSLVKNTFDDGQLCAFELLATVAGKLLRENESFSACSSAANHCDNSKEFMKQEAGYLPDEELRTEQDEQFSSEESVVSFALCLRKCTQEGCQKEVADALGEARLEHVSAVAGSDVKQARHDNEDGFSKLPSKIDRRYPNCGESFGINVDNGISQNQEVNGESDELLSTMEKFSSKDFVELCGKLNCPIHSRDKPDLALGMGSVPVASWDSHGNGVKIDSADDVEILSQCSDPSSQETAYRLTSHVRDQHTGKPLTSKYWKTAPKLEDCEPANSGSKLNNVYQDWKSFYAHKRTQCNTPFKKRKLFDQSSVLTYDGVISSESVSNNTERWGHSRSRSLANPHAGNGVSSSNIDRQRSFNSTDSHVKFSIKSFKVPELLIEVPESTTVGSLKKTIMDAVTAVLGGGLSVAVLHHGKKIHDDSRTLLQTGIAEDENLDDLDFILEPNSAILPSLTLAPEDPLALPTSELPKDHVNRLPLTPREEFSLLVTPDKTSATDLGGTCQDLATFPSPQLEKKPVSDSRALVVVPENVETLAMEPMNPRTRHSESGQRRARRPFSVFEVEALVQAVEKLGTGRWRDVKLCAFENAQHRTYVDLKDKWKTLVHTARISPQQRRGEPVPQELLDRVLAAHAFWSQHQGKQHGKQHLQQA